MRLASDGRKWVTGVRKRRRGYVGVKREGNDGCRKGLRWEGRTRGVDGSMEERREKEV